MYMIVDVNVWFVFFNIGRVFIVVVCGQLVKVIGEKVCGWVFVVVNGISGWIYQCYFIEENVYLVYFGFDFFFDIMIVVVLVNVCSDFVNVGKVFIVVECGQQVQIIGCFDGGWVLVFVNGKFGWIYGCYFIMGKVVVVFVKLKIDVKNDFLMSCDQGCLVFGNVVICIISGFNMCIVFLLFGQVINQFVSGVGV